MKKVFAILAIASFVSFAACKNNATQNEETIVDDVALVDCEDGNEEIIEEIEETPAK